MQKYKTSKLEVMRAILICFRFSNLFDLYFNMYLVRNMNMIPCPFKFSNQTCFTITSKLSNMQHMLDGKKSKIAFINEY